jgi:hypothetical protein
MGEAWPNVRAASVRCRTCARHDQQMRAGADESGMGVRIPARDTLVATPSRRRLECASAYRLLHEERRYWFRRAGSVRRNRRPLTDHWS